MATLTKAQKRELEMLYLNIWSGVTPVRKQEINIFKNLEDKGFVKDDGQGTYRITPEGIAAFEAEQSKAPVANGSSEPLPVADERKYDDKTRRDYYVKIRSFYREAVGNLYDFHDEFGTDEYGLSDEAIDEWRQMDANDEYLKERSRRLLEDRQDSEPLTARDAMLASETVLADSWLSEADNEAFAALGEPATPCDLCGKPGTPREYKSHVVMIACEDCMPSADTVDPQPVRGVTWRTMDDLPMHNFPNALMRVTFMTWRDRNWNTPISRTSKPSRDFKPRQGKRPMNMAKGGKKAFTPQSQTPKRIARKRKQWLREMERERNKSFTPVHVLKALGAVPDVSPVLEIVSHIETPLTGGERRVA